MQGKRSEWIITDWTRGTRKEAIKAACECWKSEWSSMQRAGFRVDKVEMQWQEAKAK
jgi:hypothetical protein